MSSNDSMGIVFKCLSKGAVDFLVKPIRKNELKNLWQHVWRKCHSVSYYNYLCIVSVYTYGEHRRGRTMLFAKCSIYCGKKRLNLL